MMVSIRLDPELDRLLDRTAKTLGRTKSEIVKASLRQYCRHALAERQASPYDLVKDLLGRAGSGRGDLSTKGRQHVLDLLHARRARGSR